MSLNRSDSLSSYQNSHDLFIIGKPAILKEDLLIEHVQTFPIDTLEFSREKIKEDALNRLRRSTKYLIPQLGFLRIGKYVFLTLSLPPYLLLYGLPKWVIVHALPFLINHTKGVLKSGIQKLKMPSEIILDRMIKGLKTGKKLGRNLFQPLIRLSFDLRNEFLMRGKELIEFFKNLRINKLSKTLISSGFKRIEALKNNFDYGFKQIYHGIKIIIRTHVDLLASIKIFFGKLNIGKSTWLERVKGSYHSLFKKGEHHTDKIIEYFNKGLNELKKTITPFKEVLQKYTLPYRKKVKLKLQSQFNNLKVFFRHKQTQSKKLLEKKRIALKKISYLNLLDSLFSNRLFYTLPSKVQVFLKNILLNKGVCKACEKLTQIFKNLGENLLRLLFFLFIMMDKLFKYAALYFSSMKKYWEKGKIEFKKRLFQLEDFVKKNTKKGAYFFLLLITMAGILLLFGISQLGESLDHIVGRYLFKQQKE